MSDVDGLNEGYASLLLEQYLENPEAVPSEWRALFESGDGELLEALPGLARLLENLRETNGHAEPAPAPAVPPSPVPSDLDHKVDAPDDVLLGGVCGPPRAGRRGGRLRATQAGGSSGLGSGLTGRSAGSGGFGSALTAQ